MSIAHDEPEIMRTPGGGLGLLVRPGQKLPKSEFPKMADEPRRPEPISQAKFLGWVIAANAAMVLSGVSALVAVLWGQNTALVKIATTQESMQARFSSLEAAVASGTQGRYTSSDAATANAAVVSTINSMRDAWSRSFQGLIDSNTKLASDLADIRLKMAAIEARIERPKP